MDREAFYQRIRPDEFGRVLDRRRVRRFYLLMLPVLVPVLTLATGGLILYLANGPEMASLGGITLGLGALLFVAYCIYESFLIGLYPARCYLRWLRERIDRRPDAVVSAGDPDALFVQIIPRSKWTVMMGENAGDVGLLVLDARRRELRYEGDLERWVVPTECVRSFAVRSFTPPGGVAFLNEHWVVLLRVDLPEDDDWETPLACHPVHLELWTPSRRRQRAEVLEEAIGHLVDPRQWPAVEPRRIRPLKPPRATPEVEDYDDVPRR